MVMTYCGNSRNENSATKCQRDRTSFFVSDSDSFPQIGTIAHIDTSMISNATTGTKHVCTLCSSNWGSRPWLFSKITPSYVIGIEKGLEIKSKSKLNNLIFDLFTWFQHARNQSAQTLKGAHAGSGQHEKLNQGLNHDSRTS